MTHALKGHCFREYETAPLAELIVTRAWTGVAVVKRFHLRGDDTIGGPSFAAHHSAIYQLPGSITKHAFE